MLLGHNRTNGRSQPRSYSPPLSDIDLFASTMREQGDYRTSSPGPSMQRRQSSTPPSEPPDSPLDEAEDTFDGFSFPRLTP